MNIYTDGSGRTSKQGLQGSWGLVVEKDEYYSLLGGYLEGVDSEEAELYAVFQALRYLENISYPRNQVVVVYLDNLKVAQGAAGLMYRWRENGWRKSISCRPKRKKCSSQMIDVTYWWLWEDVYKRAPKSKGFLQVDKTFYYGR